eukprot:3127219-Prymnesium_polylepis.1
MERRRAGVVDDGTLRPLSMCDSYPPWRALRPSLASVRSQETTASAISVLKVAWRGTWGLTASPEPCPVTSARSRLTA